MANNKLQIAQISDTHLFRSTDATLLGMNTEESLQATLALIKKKHPHLDAIFLTGDLSQDASPESYQRLAGYMHEFSCPSYFIPGNHDNPACLYENILSNNKPHPDIVTLNDWQIILLDSTVLGTPAGNFSLSSLAALQQHLEQNKRHTLIFLHHHPLTINSAWLDKIGVKNNNEFVALIEKFSPVKIVSFGHIHQAFEKMVNGIQYYASPSTCIQFMPNTQNFTLDTLSPGFRFFELHSDGNFSSTVCRVKDFKIHLDTETNQY